MSDRMHRTPPDAFVPVTIEVDLRTVERIFGAAAVVDPAPAVAGFLERVVTEAVGEALGVRYTLVPAFRVLVAFTTADGRRLRFEDGKGAEELDR